MTAYRSVSGVVLVSTSSRLAGPAVTTSVASAGVVYDSPSGSELFMYVSSGDPLKMPSSDVVGGSVAVGIEKIGR